MKTALVLLMVAAALAAILAARWDDYPAFGFGSAIAGCCYALLVRRYDFGKDERFR
jgi:uncharacterized membrane protein YjjB (DUF3815 family)